MTAPLIRGATAHREAHAIRRNHSAHVRSRTSTHETGREHGHPRGIRLLLLISQHPKQRPAARGRCGDEPEVLSSALGLAERLRKPMLRVLARVERSDLSIAKAGIETASFDEVGAGIQTQRVQPAVSGRGLERVHET